MFQYKTQEELEKMSAEELKQYHADMKKHEAAERQKEIEAAINPVNKAVEDAKKALADNTKDIKAIKDAVTSIEEKQRVSASPELKNFLHAIIKEKHEEIVKNFKENPNFEFVVKAAAMHMTNNGTVSNVAGLTAFPTGSFEIDNEIAFIKVPENFILNVIRNVRREKVPNQLIKRQQVATEGAVAVVEEGEVKPLLQYKFENTATSRKKYAGRIEWAEEFEMDFETLLDAIIDMFERDVLTAWQDGLIDIIETNATAYVSSSLDGTLVAPDNALAVIAAAQQIRVLGGLPNYALMNPADIDAAVFTQDANGNFQLKPYIDAAGNRINGITLIPSLKVDAGTAVVGDFSIYKEIHSGIILRRGQYADQFIENEYTMVGEVFSILSAAPAHYKYIAKINLATVKTALTKAAG